MLGSQSATTATTYAITSQTALFVLLAAVGGGFVGSLLPARASAPVAEQLAAVGPSEMQAILGALTEIRLVIEASTATDNGGLAAVAPRRPVAAAADHELPDAEDLRSLVAILERLEQTLATLPGGSVSAGGARRAAFAESLRVAQRPQDASAVRDFVDQVLLGGEQEMPLHMGVFGLADHLDLFGEPARYNVDRVGNYGLVYPMQPNDPDDDRALVIVCTVDRTIEMRYRE